MYGATPPAAVTVHVTDCAVDALARLGVTLAIASSGTATPDDDSVTVTPTAALVVARPLSSVATAVNW